MQAARTVLRVLTLLSFGGGLALLALGIHISIHANWKLCAAIVSLIGLLISLLSLLGFFGAKREKSRPLLVYFYLNFALVAALLVSIYVAFSYQELLDAYIKHHWRTDSLDALREQSCCHTYEDAKSYVHERATILGSVALACLIFVLSAMYCVIRILTVPIVMKSMLGVLNFHFLCLGIVIFSIGLVFKSRAELTTDQDWIATIFLVAGALLLALSVIGVIGSRAKSRNMLLIYVGGISIALVAMVVVAFGAFLQADKVARNFVDLPSSDTLACELSLSQCSNCTTNGDELVECVGVYKKKDNAYATCTNSTSDSKCQEGKTIVERDPDDTNGALNEVADCRPCPEWTKEDLVSYLVSRVNVLGLIACVACVFIIAGASGALILRRSLAGYQSDSI